MIMIKLPEKYIHCICKFGTLEHLEEMRNEGVLYMNTIAYFKKHEQEGVRGDKNEGIRQYFQNDFVKIHIKKRDGTEYVINKDNGLAGPVRVGFKEDETQNVFCTYAIVEEGSKPQIDKKNIKFGDHVLVILNTEQFHENIMENAKRQDKWVEARLVKYIDLTSHNGDVDMFTKSDEFLWQSEYRIVLNPGEGNGYKFRIGSMKDYSIIIKADQLNDSLHYEIKNDTLHTTSQTKENI